MNVKFNNKTVARVSGLWAIPIVILWVWLMAYGFQWAAVSLLNFLFDTHVKMTLLNWAIVTVLFFVFRFYKFGTSKS